MHYIINNLMVLYFKKYYTDFIRASFDPVKEQCDIMKRIIKSNENTLFGKDHCFKEIENYNDLKRRIPLTDYNYYENYINRIINGENNILTDEKVDILEPTSGSTRGTKLIPYTRALQNDFQKGIYPWIYDMYTSNRKLSKGTAYWAISPSSPIEKIDSKIPIGFKRDSQYLGIFGEIIEKTMAVPSYISSIRDIDKWKYYTVLFLLKDANLSFISVWNPEYLNILTQYIYDKWDELLKDIRNGFSIKGGINKNISANPYRYKQLLKCKDENRIKFDRIWEKLCLLSCWTSGNAKYALEKTKRTFPHIKIQGKGIIATEGFISFPLTNQRESILSIRSHFFEFQDIINKDIYLVNELKKNKRYSVIITNSGGFYRYTLKDIIEVKGFYNKLPIIEFIGKQDMVLDYFGEKLEEIFIINILKKSLKQTSKLIDFMCFAPNYGDEFKYILYISCSKSENIDTKKIEENIEYELCNNYHYKHARNLGQIGKMGIVILDNSINYLDRYLTYMYNKGMKIGDIKPIIVSNELEIKKIFEGK